MRNPPASAPREETPPVPNQPMQTRSTRKKFKAEVRSKWHEEKDDAERYFEKEDSRMRDDHREHRQSAKDKQIEKAMAVVELAEGMMMMTGI